MTPTAASVAAMPMLQQTGADSKPVDSGDRTAAIVGGATTEFVAASADGPLGRSNANSVGMIVLADVASVTAGVATSWDAIAAVAAAAVSGAQFAGGVMCTMLPHFGQA
jgi:hypothetical protein